MNKTLRVLIVEDCEDDALLLVRELERAGYELTYDRVDTAADMSVALDSVNWDMVITDFSMPQFSAFAALEILGDKGLDLPCIVVSGTIGEDTAVTTMKGGAHDYIMKDNLNRLIPAIQRELRDAEVRRERRRAEEALRASEERYRSLVENIDIGVILIDPDFNIVMINAAQRRIIGSGTDDLLGRKCYEVFDRLNKVCSSCPVARAMDRRQPVEVETTIFREPVERRTLRIQAFPVYGRNGEVTGCIEVMEDITDRKRLEEQLRQAARLEAIGGLAGGIAHDFNNLLTAMLGYSTVLLEEIPAGTAIRDRVFQISRAAERAAELTRQLLAFGRKQVLSMKAMDLNPLILDFKSILVRLVGEDIELDTSLQEDLSRVKADAGQIEQILMNLVVNARDAMPRGGKLTIETADVELDAEFTKANPDIQPGHYVMFAVNDTGIGMDGETRCRIFDPFFTTKEVGKGTGLGLSTVYGIVEQHRGHISVYSEGGCGTSFKIYLPRVSQEPQHNAELSEFPQRIGGSETVLVVEDEEMVRKLAAEVLEMLGYFVLSAHDPREAIRVSRHHEGPIDLLLTDVILPQMDGATLFHRLSGERPEMKSLFISGYTESFIIQHGVLNPGVCFLQKPFTLDSLAAKVREVLDEP